MSAYQLDASNSLNKIWEINTTDSSGATGMTIFDLNGDGINELIYRDETALKIFNATNNIPK